MPRLLYNKALEINAEIYQFNDPASLIYGSKLKKKGKKVILFGLPGAFTSVCSASHLPGYVSSHESYKAKGIYGCILSKAIILTLV